MSYGGWGGVFMKREGSFNFYHVYQVDVYRYSSGQITK